MNRRIFILESDESCFHWFKKEFSHCDITQVKTVSEAEKKFNPPYEIIFLNTDAGYEFSEYLMNNYNIDCDVVIHSTDSEILEQKLKQNTNASHIYKIPFSVLQEYWNTNQISICGRKKDER
jgi:hypothetical protein